MKSILAILLFLTAGTIQAGQLKLAWDAPASPASQFTIYAATNEITAANLSESLVKINVDTNQTASISDLQSGTWYFAATETLNGVESSPSANLIATVPPAPKNLRTVILQYSADLTNWTNVNFFKLKVP